MNGIVLLCTVDGYNQSSFLVPLIGGRYHIIPQLAIYTTYIPLIYSPCLLGDFISPIPPIKGTIETAIDTIPIAFGIK